MRITLFLTVIFLLSQFTIAQNDLNTALTDFSKEYELYNKWLNELEAIRSSKELSGEKRHQKWLKMLKKWDKGNRIDSFCLQNIFKDQNLTRCPCNESPSNKDCLGIKGYPLNYLLTITDQYQSEGKLSELNAKVLKNILTYQIDNEQSIEQDVEMITAGYIKHFDRKRVPMSKLEMEEVVNFVKGDRDYILDVRSHISGFGEQDFQDLKNFLKEKQISFSDVLLSIYVMESGAVNYFSFWNYTHPLYKKVSTPVAFDFCQSQPRTEWRLNNLEPLDVIKYAAFFESPVIFDITVFKFLFDAWEKFETEKFENSGTNNYLMSKGLLSDIHTFLATVERRFPSHYFGKDYKLDSKSHFEQLFIAAYNDIYFELGVDRWVGYPEGEIDARSFDLSEYQLKIVEAILNMDEASTRSELQSLLMDRNFDDFETERSFRLACYLAFREKHTKMDRDWNHDEFYPNPFVSEKKDKSYPILALGVEEMEKCKQVMQNVIQTTVADGGKFCFTSYGAYWNSLFPKLSMKHTNSMFKYISALNVVDLNSRFLRLVIDVKPVSGTNPGATSETILLPLEPTPDPGPPTIIFRESPKPEALIVESPDAPARFPGGEAAMNVWMQEKVQYPSLSKELGDQGRVYVQFIVEVDGAISNVEVMRGGVTPELNREAKRVVRGMPKWTPGELNGEKVRTRSIVPLDFVLSK